MLPLTICFAFLIAPVYAGDLWDDFYNNFATDLTPLLALFGEQVTKQFLSESTSILDNVIFAAAPLGILTAVVSVLRLYGTPSQRAFIGRAQEAQAVAEAELCSSTSHDVCELWHRGGIAKVFGRPRLLEVIFDRNAGEFYPQNPGNPAEAHIFTLPEYFTDEQNNVGNQNPKGDSKPRTQSISSSQHRDTEEGKSSIFAPSPNLSLNIGIKKPSRFLLWLSALFGCLLQGGVFVFAAWITYFRKLGKEGKPAPYWAFPIALTGTSFLAIGMFLCARLIEKTTEEYDVEMKPQKMPVLWLQQGNQRIADQVFGRYAYSANLDKYTVSKKVDVEKVSLWTRELLASMAVAFTCLGFILQFVGLRGLHSFVALFQLGATVSMALIRAGLRSQRAGEKGNELRNIGEHIDGHELDWFAHRIELEDKFQQFNTLVWNFPAPPSWLSRLGGFTPLNDTIGKNQVPDLHQEILSTGLFPENQLNRFFRGIGSMWLLKKENICGLFCRSQLRVFNHGVRLQPQQPPQDHALYDFLDELRSNGPVRGSQLDSFLQKLESLVPYPRPLGACPQNNSLLGGSMAAIVFKFFKGHGLRAIKKTPGSLEGYWEVQLLDLFETEYATQPICLDGPPRPRQNMINELFDDVVDEEPKHSELDRPRPDIPGSEWHPNLAFYREVDGKEIPMSREEALRTKSEIIRPSSGPGICIARANAQGYYESLVVDQEYKAYEADEADDEQADETTSSSPAHVCRFLERIQPLENSQLDTFLDKVRSTGLLDDGQLEQLREAIDKSNSFHALDNWQTELRYNTATRAQRFGFYAVNSGTEHSAYVEAMTWIKELQSETSSATHLTPHIAARLLYYRARIARLTQGRSSGLLPEWKIDIRNTAERLAAAIEGTAAIIFSKTNLFTDFSSMQVCFWKLNIKTGRKDRDINPIYLTIKRFNQAWKVEVSELEAALGLWIWTIRRRNMCAIKNLDKFVGFGDSKLTIHRAKTNLILWRAMSGRDRFFERQVPKPDGWPMRRSYPIFSIPMASLESTGNNSTDTPSDVASNLFSSLFGLFVPTACELPLMCAQDIFASFFTHATGVISPDSIFTPSLSSSGETAPLEAANCQLTNGVVKSIVEVFSNSGLGSADDGLLSIIPILDSKGFLMLSAQPLEAIMKMAIECRRRGDLKSAESFLIWHYYGLSDITRELLQYKVAFFKELAEVYRRALISTTFEVRSYGYKGILELSDAFQGDEALRETRENYLWAAFQISRIWDDSAYMTELGAKANKQLVQGIDTMSLWSALGSLLDPVCLIIGIKWRGQLRYYGDQYDCVICRAAKNGHNELVEELLDRSCYQRNEVIADEDIQHDCEAPFYAARRGDLDLLNIFLNSSDRAFPREKLGGRWLYAAVKSGNYGVVEELLKRTEGNYYHHYNSSVVDPALSEAVLGSHKSIVKILLDSKANIELDPGFSFRISHSGRTALMDAVLDFENQKRLDILGLLLQKKAADANAVDLFGCTALHYAARKGNSESIRILILHGARTDIKNKLGETPLYRAVVERQHAATSAFIHNNPGPECVVKGIPILYRLVLEKDYENAVRFVQRTEYSLDMRENWAFPFLSAVIDTQDYVLLREILHKSQCAQNLGSKRGVLLQRVMGEVPTDEKKSTSDHLVRSRMYDMLKEALKVPPLERYGFISNIEHERAKPTKY